MESRAGTDATTEVGPLTAQREKDVAEAVEEGETLGDVAEEPYATSEAREMEGAGVPLDVEEYFTQIGLVLY